MSHRRDHSGNSLDLFHFKSFSAKEHTPPGKKSTFSTGDTGIAGLNIADTLTTRITHSYPYFRTFQKIHGILKTVSQ